MREEPSSFQANQIRVKSSSRNVTQHISQNACHRDHKKIELNLYVVKLVKFELSLQSMKLLKFKLDLQIVMFLKFEQNLQVGLK